MDEPVSVKSVSKVIVSLENCRRKPVSDEKSASSLQEATNTDNKSSVKRYFILFIKLRHSFMNERKMHLFSILTD